MNFEKKNNIYKVAMIIIVTVIVTFIATSVLLYNYYFKTENGLVKTLGNTQANSLDEKTKIIKTYIDKFYLGEINEENMTEYAIKGYVEGLGDEYTEYLTKSEYEDLMIDVNGNYVGIGIYMTQDRDGNVVVLLPIEGSPAEAAGIKTGDIITKVNGETCTDMDLSVVAKKVKGEEGTTVELEIHREEEILTKKLERKRVETNQIEAEVLENDIGYIQILAFDNECSIEFEKKLDELMSKGIKSLIVDVRDNGGGIVTEAIDIAELFVPRDKTIMKEVDKNQKEEITIAKKDAKINSDIEVVILANGHSASASEILIGALKDNDVARVVGEKTFGKGVMQEIVPVSTGGALKLTIKEFKTPNGNKINKEGIKPDIEVKEEKDSKEDVQLQRAIEELK